MYFLRPQSLAERLQQAVCRHDVPTLTRILQEGGKVDSRDRLGDSALMWAAALGHQDMVDLLVAHGANPKTANANGDTPAHLAARQGFLDLARHFCTLHPTLQTRPNHFGMTVRDFLIMPAMVVKDESSPAIHSFRFPSRGVSCR
jgi:ankyrin repeat protein